MAERQQHDKAWGLDFGEVGDVKLVPPDYIGESAAKKKGLFSFFGGSKTLRPQDYEKVAVTEYPISVKMRASLDQALKQNPQMVEQTSDEGMNFLHQLSLAGSWDGVDVCLKNGADPRKAAANGMTPYELAKCLDWKRVRQRLEQVGGA